jgi:hypothetical protein
LEAAKTEAKSFGVMAKYKGADTMIEPVVDAYDRKVKAAINRLEEALQEADKLQNVLSDAFLDDQKEALDTYDEDMSIAYYFNDWAFGGLKLHAGVNVSMRHETHFNIFRKQSGDSQGD